MIEFSVDIDNRALKKFLRLAPPRIDRAIKLSLEQSALAVRNRGKINAPKKSGNLRRSITHRLIKDRTAIAGTNLIYARFQEYNNKSKPNGYMRPALRDSRSDIQRIFTDNINRALKI